MRAAGSRRSRSLGAALAALCLAAAGPARAHVVVDGSTLRQWLATADLAVVAEFEGDVQMWEAPDGSDRQEWFRVRVLETLRGEAREETLDFFPHAEGFPRFRAGDRALLFLERTSGSPEWVSLAPRFPWFSGQGAGQEWILAPGEAGEAILAIARRWARPARERATDPRRWLRALLVDELGSGLASLRADALRELIALRELPGFLDADTTAALAVFADSRSLPATQRLALARLLDGAPGFAAGPRLRALAREGLEGAALTQLVWAAAGEPDPELRAWLAALARDHPRPAVRRDASAALARGNPSEEGPSGKGPGSFVR
jgi:hypothetical protein